MFAAVDVAPIRHRMMEADWIVRIGNARTRLRIGERGKVRELLTPARRHFRREPGLVIGEVQERRAAAPFLAHEQQWDLRADDLRSEEHTSELQSLMRISYAVLCLKKK